MADSVTAGLAHLYMSITCHHTNSHLSRRRPLELLMQVASWLLHASATTTFFSTATMLLWIPCRCVVFLSSHVKPMMLNALAMEGNTSHCRPQLPATNLVLCHAGARTGGSASGPSQQAITWESPSSQNITSQERAGQGLQVAACSTLSSAGAACTSHATPVLRCQRVWRCTRRHLP